MPDLIVSQDVKDKVAVLCTKLDNLILWVAAQAADPNDKDEVVISPEVIDELDGLLESALLSWLDSKKGRKNAHRK